MCQKVCQWEKQIKNMKDLLDTLKHKQLTANEQHVVLNHNFGDLAVHLVKNQQKKIHNTYHSTAINITQKLNSLL